MHGKNAIDKYLHLMDSYKKGLLMKIRTSKTILFLLLVLVFSACNSDPPQTVHVPQTTSQTETVIEPPSQTTATWYLKTASPVLPTPPPNDIGYYEGIIVITQYYTFLGHGLYEEAYQLLSSSAQVYPVEDFVKSKQQAFRKVKILTVQPYHVFVKEQGGHLRSFDSMNMRQFYVQIIAWGEGKMSGSRMSGEVQTLFLRLVIEDGEWKIDEFGTAPLF